MQKSFLSRPLWTIHRPVLSNLSIHPPVHGFLSWLLCRAGEKNKYLSLSFFSISLSLTHTHSITVFISIFKFKKQKYNNNKIEKKRNVTLPDLTWVLFNDMRWLGFIFSFVFRSIFRTIMGCLFTCFRVRDNKRNLPKTAAAAVAVSSRHNKANVT